MINYSFLEMMKAMLGIKKRQKATKGATGCSCRRNNSLRCHPSRPHGRQAAMWQRKISDFNRSVYA